METVIRLSIAIAIFGLMVGWEYARPRRTLYIGRQQRWPTNLGLAAFNIFVMRFSLGGAAFLSAATAADRGYGLLNLLPVPGWLAVILTLLFLDFAVYGQHIVMHKWPLMWRLHQVHHTDLEFDATTAVRFHPLEIMISMVYKVLCIFLIGASPWAVVAFEVLLNGAATFNHSNINIPPEIDQKLRWLVVTPDMHRIHHSTNPAETDSNYGFSFSLWDRLCDTYVDQPNKPQTAMDIGLEPFREVRELGFVELLLLPFQALRKQ